MAHSMELEQITGRARRARWTLGLVPLTARVLWNQLRYHPRSFGGGSLVRSALAVFVVANGTIASGLLLLFIWNSNSPPSVLAFVSVLVAQAAYSVFLILRRRRPPAFMQRMLVVASAIGIISFIAALGVSIGASDPEYGPPTVVLVVSLHAAMSYAAAGPNRDEGFLRPQTPA